MVTRSDDRLRGRAGGGLGRSRPRLRRRVPTGAGRVRRRHGTERSGATARGNQDGCAGQDGRHWCVVALRGLGFPGFRPILFASKPLFKQTRMRRKVRECSCGQRVSPRPETGQEPESRGKLTRRSWLRNPNARCRASPHPNTPSRPAARCGVDRPTPYRREQQRDRPTACPILPREAPPDGESRRPRTHGTTARSPDRVSHPASRSAKETLGQETPAERLTRTKPQALRFRTCV